MMVWSILYKKFVTAMYELKVKNGTYKSDSLTRLLWAVICHRFHHWRKGEGFVD